MNQKPKDGERSKKCLPIQRKSYGQNIINMCLIYNGEYNASIQVTLSVPIQANNIEEAKKEFWHIIDNMDYPVEPIITEEKE